MGDCREKTPGRVILATERLILREMTEEDLPALRSMLQDIEVMYAWEHAFSEEEVRQWLERTLARYRDCGCGHWLAVERESGEPVGQIGLIPEEIDGRSHLGIGWMLRREFQHRGYATEAARGCLEHAFRQRKAGRVIADIRPENASSLRVAARLGMIRAGRYEKPVGGGIIDVPTMTGKVRMKVPEGTQSGAVLRIKGRGFPATKGGGKGDQLVKIQVETPVALTKQQRDLLNYFTESLTSSNYPVQSRFEESAKRYMS